MKKKTFSLVLVILIVSFTVFIVQLFITVSSNKSNQYTAYVKPENALPILTTEDGVTKVNGHVLVNEQYSLPKTYNPGESKHARRQLNKLLAQAEKEEIDLKYRSGFRSYEEQQKLIKQAIKQDGRQKAYDYTAKPGHSEHQTGLAFDVGTDAPLSNFKKEFGHSKEGRWLAKHAKQYGFIIRYPKGEENWTGYEYEPWHLRYVGDSLAHTIHEEQTSLEKYYNLK
ncbi:D-alanyl-D-alanine carboxypeptidase family protein [Staphylococcus arlettae]|uniref:M15 family metallopeptidase n=1 Tax=Staphylococcus arlettae TaxID=29378 RepID=UPI0010718915|nr:M15 family metallopeptidase [Staphylococcus arlettae]MBF0737888.1 M15 family metallopeptidase [Staphylococcus arlettae]TFU46936.1 D-alanyl-D-alanine carboxypeptidase family protein [Staphylococcus arlettae]